MPRHHRPAQHTRFNAERPCERKRKFKSEAEALDAIEHATLVDMNLELTTYQCPYCNGWHLSSIKP